MTTRYVASFGSLNVDLTIRLARHPDPDETVTARNLQTFLGGKGANQATAAARLGAPVAMIGAVGTDEYGDRLLAGLGVNRVDCRFVRRVAGPSGIAVPMVAENGDVRIVIVPGANAAVSDANADAAREVLEQTAVLLVQGEVSTEASRTAARIVVAAGGIVVYNPAPVRNDAALLLGELRLGRGDVLIANRVEAGALAVDPLAPGVVVTHGAAGATVQGATVPSPAAQLRDPTGAGDAFAAAVAVRLSEGAELVEAVRFGCAAGSCAVEIDGAEPSFPTPDAVNARLPRR